MTLIGRFLRDQRGATAIEYGLIAALIAVTSIVAFTFTGNSVTGMFSYIVDEAAPVLNR